MVSTPKNVFALSVDTLFSMRFSMSTNLHLGTEESSLESLFQTPTHVTFNIMRNLTRGEKLIAYFAWVRDSLDLLGGAFLDHQIEVLWYLVDNPTADFYAA